MDMLYTGWARAGLDSWMLALEASAVVGLRMAKVARGGEAANAEMRLMVTEKMHSAIDLPAELGGKTPLAGVETMLRHYRSKVSANRRRLTR